MKIQKPHRATRSYVQHLKSSPAEVFPLLCPVREADWIEGWLPLSVISETGLAEKDGVFLTPGNPEPSVWYITERRPKNGFMEMLKVTPQFTACRITIQLRATENGTDAEITYSHTSLGPDGDAFVEQFTEAYYEEFMLAWQTRLNYYLQTGECLRGVEF